MVEVCVCGLIFTFVFQGLLPCVIFVGGFASAVFLACFVVRRRCSLFVVLKLISVCSCSLLLGAIFKFHVRVQLFVVALHLYVSSDV